MFFIPTHYIIHGFRHTYFAKKSPESRHFRMVQHTRHPHCHIVFNRVDNDDKMISDKNNFRRNEKVSKMLTAKYPCSLPMVNSISKRNDCILMTEQSMRYTKR